MTDMPRNDTHSIYRHLPLPVLEIANTHAPFMVTSANRAAELLLGKAQGDLIGRSFTDIVLPADGDTLPDWQLYIQQACEQNEPKTITNLKVYAPAGDHLYRYLDIVFTPVQSGTDICEHVIATITDVTNQAEAMLEIAEVKRLLAKKDDFLNETQRVSRNGTWEIELDNDRVLWSDMMREIHEIPPDFKLTNETALSFYRDEETREKVVTLVQDAIAKGQVFDIELEIITGKGNLRWLRSTGKADLTDGTIRLYGTAQDITEQKNIQSALIDSRNRHKSLIQSIEGIVWEADALTFEFSYVSSQVENILGYTADEWLNETDFWSNHIHPDDRSKAVNFCVMQTKGGRNHTFDYRMFKADGSIVWIKDVVSVISTNGVPTLLRGVMVDITETKLLEDLDHLEKQVLELNFSKDIEIETVLKVYADGMEQLFPSMKCSVLRVRDNRVYEWVSPSLPPLYIQSLNNLEIGPDAGSCGASAYFKEKVITADIEVDPKWANYKHYALPFGIRSCWSFPIIDSEGTVIAVLGIYHETVKTPNAKEAEIIERTVSILNVLLENRLNVERISETNMLITQGQELANFGTWQWEVEKNVVTWSDVLYNIYGLDKSTFHATFEGYISMLHPDDRERVSNIIRNVLETRTDIWFEERIIRPNGEERTLRSWGRVILNDEGNPIKMVGACLDITEAMATRVKLEEIAWLQSHVIRAPLARLMGLVNILQNECAQNIQQDELISHILSTAHELDDVVRNISSKTN